MKKIFYILIFIVGFTGSIFAQSKTSLPADQSARVIKFFPNPAVSVINFEFEKDFDKFSTFQIYNFIGKKVFDTKSITSKMNVPLTDFYRGVYIYQLRDRSGKIIESGKFQVVK